MKRRYLPILLLALATAAPATADSDAVDSMAAHYLAEAVRAEESSIYAYDNPLNQEKHPWKAAVEAFGINVGVQLFDRFVLDADFAKINFKTIRHNIEHGFVWDNDQFSTNLFAHP